MPNDIGDKFNVIILSRVLIDRGGTKISHNSPRTE